MIHPAIYTQPSEILPGDPREKHILVGSWDTQWESVPKKRLRLALDRIAPQVCGVSARKSYSDPIDR